MITIDINKAKNIAHDKRRQARAKEFEPWDNVIAKQIPGNDLNNAETKRQEIRAKYDVVQQQINEAQTVEDLKSILSSLEK